MQPFRLQAWQACTKKIFLLLFCTDSNHSPLPLTGLAATPQSSPLRSEHERHFSPIVRGSHKKRIAKAVPCLYAEFMELLLPPDRACGCAAKLSASLRARTSARERVRGSHKKRTAKAVSFTLLFNIHNLPLTGLAPAAQSSPLSLRARTSFHLNC